jgi:hypothetical protein
MSYMVVTMESPGELHSHAVRAGQAFPRATMTSPVGDMHAVRDGESLTLCGLSGMNARHWPDKEWPPGMGRCGACTRIYFGSVNNN